MKRRLETYFLSTLFVSPEVNTDLLWNFTLIFVMLCGLYFGFIFFFRNKLSNKSKAVEKRKKELTPMIVEFLFYDENLHKQEETDQINLKVEIRELINNSFNRKVLIDILMYLRKDLSGTTLSKLFRLYQELGLHHDSYKKLDSWKWQNISKGILELTQMNVVDSYVFITKFINDKRSTIRKQAEVAIITLKAEGLNYFLDTTTYRISEWQQLKILEVLINKKNYLPPSFNHWLMSKNNDVVLFALRLMKNYNQNDGNEALIELLKHKNSDIKMAAMSCIKEFHVVEALANLKLVFWNSKIDVKIGILDVISCIGDKNEIAFLESVVAKESNFNVKSKSLACINVLEPMSVLPTIGIQASDTFTIPNNLPVDSVGDNLKKVTRSTTVIVEDDIIIQPNNYEDTKIESKSGVEENLPAKLLVTTELDLSVTTAEEQNNAIELGENNSVSSLINSPILDEFNLGFLPLIILQEEVFVSKYNPNEKIEVTNMISDIEVIFNEFESTEFEESTINEKNEVEVLEYKLSDIVADFIPIVVQNEENTVTQSPVPETINLTDLSVVYTEIVTSTLDDIKINIEANKSVPQENSNQTSSSIKNIDMKDLRNIECDVNEVIIKPQKLNSTRVSKDSEIFQDVSTDNHKEKIALEWVLSENEARSEMKQKIKTILNQQDSIAFNIPKPIFYNESQANTMALLDDIEALGDSREILLLNELLNKETEKTIYERIEYLIAKLENTAILKRLPIKHNHAEFSVFEKYFLGLDTQSKLILLDEVAAVGDEKEIPFLRRLIAGTNEKISKKAEKCLGDLLLKLNKENVGIKEDSTESISNDTVNSSEPNIDNITAPIAKVIEKVNKKPFNVFDIDFELEDLKDNK